MSVKASEKPSCYFQNVLEARGGLCLEGVREVLGRCVNYFFWKKAKLDNRMCMQNEIGPEIEPCGPSQVKCSLLLIGHLQEGASCTLQTSKT